MKIASVTDPITAMGLRLVGVREAREVSGEGEAKDILEKLLKDREIGVIILTERLAQELGEELEREEENVTPIIVEIPDKEGPLPERLEIIDKIVKRAVGVEVKR